PQSEVRSPGRSHCTDRSRRDLEDTVLVAGSAWMQLSRRIGVACLITAVAGGAASAGLGAASAQKTPSDRLAPGQKLTPGGYLQSVNARFTLNLQGDGNFVLYQQRANLWDAQTHGSHVRAVMQSDGNLVVYSSANKPLWQSRTAGHPGAGLVLQNDGNAVIRTSGGGVLWSSGTANPPRRVLMPRW